MLPGEQYHIFNHANGCKNIFIEQRNYSFFLEKLEEHILPVCRIYAYCLLPNHFHIVIEVKTDEELNILWKKPGAELVFQPDKLKLKTSKAFGNFFSSYTQSFNKVCKGEVAFLYPV